MTYSPGHDSASAVTRFFAASRVCVASTKRGLPSPRNLRMQKGRPNQTPRTIYKGAVGRLSHEFGVLGTGRLRDPKSRIKAPPPLLPTIIVRGDMSRPVTT